MAPTSPRSPPRPRGSHARAPKAVPRARSARRRRAPAAALAALIEQSGEGMILADAEGKILFANAAAERLLGVSRASLLGLNGFTLCHPDDLAAARAAFACCLDHPGRTVRLRVRLAADAAAGRGLAVTVANQRDGDVAAMVVTFTPAAIDPVVPAAYPLDALDGSPQVYRTLFDQAPVGLGLADLEGNLLAFNRHILEPGGYTRADILEIGNVARLYTRQADRERLRGIAGERGYVWREEVQFRRKDGSDYDTLLSLLPVHVAGRRCWYAMVEDITERKRAEAERQRLEAQLRRAQKMEAVGRMTAGIAHDFNNLLSIVLANAELIRGAVAPEAAGDLAELLAATQHGAAMVGKLLGFSKQAMLRAAPVDLGALVTSLEGLLRHIVPEHIALDISAAPGCVAIVDAGAVEQILINLGSNARDAIRDNGVIRIAVNPVQVGTDHLAVAPWMTPGAFIRVVVSDTGCGMDEATRVRVFEPFFSTKPVGVGTGLGMAMVYGLVKQQGGFIDVWSAVGQGTVVTLYLPQALATPTAGLGTPSPDVTPALLRGTETILLIEDEAGLRRTGQRVLERLGYRVLVAADGAAGLATYRERAADIDLVISDIVMPNLTGPELYAAIQREFGPTRFLFASGYRRDAVDEIAIPALVPVILKPWTLEAMARMVREVLDTPTDRSAPAR